jgi:MSHA biogenesis protein MshI
LSFSNALDAISRRPWRRAAGAGWLGVYSASHERIVAAVSTAPATAATQGRPTVQVAPVFDGVDPAAALLQWQAAHHRGARANVLLNSVDYRITTLDTPPVPLQERREAVRWQLQDMIEFPADTACIDCIAVPGPTLGTESRQLFAVASQPQLVGGWMQRFRDARLSLGAIDIPEMAMRNLSVLCAGDAAHAFVHLGLKSTRLVLVWQRELCSFRQFDVSAFKLDAADAETRAMVLERLAVEIQRSTDSFSRQFHGADLGVVWVSAVRDADEISAHLSQLLPQKVQAFRAEDHVALISQDPVVDPERGLDFTFAIGAALRQQVH